MQLASRPFLSFSRSCVRLQTRLKQVAALPVDEESKGFSDRYAKAFSMAQLHAAERPAPIPVSEHEERCRRREVAEICQAAGRLGKSEAFVRERLAKLESLIPSVVTLHKMKASDWVNVLCDVDGVAAKLIALKSVFPRASAFKVVTHSPRLLLRSTEDVMQEALLVQQALSSLPDPDSIIEGAPDLISLASLNRALLTIRAAFPGCDPLQVLQKTPTILYSMEGDIEDSAEYGEITTNL